MSARTHQLAFFHGDLTAVPVIYTVPAGHVTIVKWCAFDNDNRAVASDLALYARDPTAGHDCLIATGHITLAVATFQPIYAVLKAGDELVGFSGTEHNGRLLVAGSELDA